MAAHENPFATRFIEPGALEYAFFGEGSLDRLVQEFFGTCHGRAAIVGPHGSGKTTLLHSLVPRIGNIQVYRDLANPDTSRFLNESKPASSVTKNIRWFRLSAQARDSRQVLNDRQQWDRNSIVVVDGFEQMPIWRRYVVRWLTRRCGAGLLVTAHSKPVGLPVLWQTSVTPQSAEYVVRTLLANRQIDVERLLASPEWGTIRGKWDDNLREALFDLYDLVEDKRFS